MTNLPSADTGRRAKNNRTLSLSRSYIRENASASSITSRSAAAANFCDADTPPSARRRPQRPTHPGRLAIPDRRSRF